MSDIRFEAIAMSMYFGGNDKDLSYLMDIITTEISDVEFGTVRMPGRRFL